MMPALLMTNVERREVRGDFCGELADAFGLLDVENGRGHAGVGARDFVERRRRGVPR